MKKLKTLSFFFIMGLSFCSSLFLTTYASQDDAHSERFAKLSFQTNANNVAHMDTPYKDLYENSPSCLSLLKNLTSARIDLHGKSLEDAKSTVIRLIHQCHFAGGVSSIHFICGRGKHKNKKGERGVIFKNFPEWLKEDSTASLIADYHQSLGAYEVLLKPLDSSNCLQNTEDKVLKVAVIKFLADLGDAHAQYILGIMHADGDRVEKSDKLAVLRFREAAEQEHEYAQLMLGYMCAMGKGTLYSPKEALICYHRAEKQGNKDAMFNIATMYHVGEGVLRDLQEAFKWYLKAGKYGHPKAMNMLGIFYRHGYGVKRDDEEAVRWDRKGAEAGNPHAKVNLGCMLLIGRGVTYDPIEGVKWLKEGANYGLAEGQLRLGRAYEQGEGLDKDYQEAFKYYLMAALQENGAPSDDAYYFLGQLYEEGNGTKKNIKLANRAYLRAAKNGHPKAEEELGHHYRFSHGFARDCVEAVKWYRISANKGNPGAQYALGEMYEMGQGVPINQKKADYWIKKSAEGGYAMGLLRFGIIPSNIQAWLEETELSRSQNISHEESNQDQEESLSKKDISNNDIQQQVEEAEHALIPTFFHAKETYNEENNVKIMYPSDQSSFTYPSWAYGASILTLTLVSYYVFG